MPTFTPYGMRGAKATQTRRAAGGAVCGPIRQAVTFAHRDARAFRRRGSRHVSLLGGPLVGRVMLLPDGVECEAFARRDGSQVRRDIGAGEGTTVLGIVSTIGWEGQLELPSPGWDLVECLARLTDLDV